MPTNAITFLAKTKAPTRVTKKQNKTRKPTKPPTNSPSHKTKPPLKDTRNPTKRSKSTHRPTSTHSPPSNKPSKKAKLTPNPTKRSPSTSKPSRKSDLKNTQNLTKNSLPKPTNSKALPDKNPHSLTTAEEEPTQPVPLVSFRVPAGATVDWRWHCARELKSCTTPSPDEQWDCLMNSGA
eukprot:CAMPEP_0175170982 /NCGR_PEP_ID=MMETSP0087-20121206/30538_1 /TAXON_ID=136419 /ORGANISM="Unknown Unknown, Strain D1" /LENGTH=179 /DNA_ID=CAMNT_0016461719 /DNA_START=298 /DNA_END=834 /DNA_ORIENTATION=-